MVVEDAASVVEGWNTVMVEPDALDIPETEPEAELIEPADIELEGPGPGESGWLEEPAEEPAEELGMLSTSNSSRSLSDS